MKNIINALLTGLIFWLGNEYFGEYISIENTKILILATLFMFIINYLYCLLMMVSAITVPIGIGCLGMILLIFLAFVLTPIKLLLLDTYLNGFTINGFWTYVVMTAILSMFSINSKTNKKESK